MIFDIHLNIAYLYEYPSEIGRQLLRIMPRDIPGIQRLVLGSQTLDPRPAEQINRTDFFQNQFSEVLIAGTHKKIVFDMRARVERILTTNRDNHSAPYRDIAQEITAIRSLQHDAPLHYLGSSPRIAPDAGLTAYGRESLDADASICEIVERLGTRLHQDMTFDPEATTVYTSATEAFRQQRGVCQDFSHIMISALRGMSIPAGYVSGFLRTNPPKGQPRLEGADAMHAWVKVWGGKGAGWIEYDPTNGVFVAGDHIVIAEGRDYSDVSPVRGVTKTHGKQRSEQKVTVTPLS